MTRFPQKPAFTGFNTPLRAEIDIVDVEAEGEIPSALYGAYYRAQPDPQFPPRLGDDILFNGDGSISMFRFDGGKVDFKHRWARTDKFLLEREAGEALFGAYRNPLTDDPSVKGRYRGTANTNAFPFADKLYALKEDSPPVLMDLDTLETQGYTTFDGKMTGQTFTAHPKIDPVTGNMVAFGYAARGLCTRDMTYYEVDPQGRLACESWFELPYYCMMHDFGVTRDYAVFHVAPIVGSIERLEKGLPHFGFDTSKDVYLGVIRRDDPDAKPRWFKTENCFASHVMNAFNEGSKIYFDTPVAKNNMFPFFPDVDGHPFNPVDAQAYLTRWCVDLNGNSDAFFSKEVIGRTPGEFPRIDDRYAMAAYRHGYMLVQDSTKPVDPACKSITGFAMNTLCHVDVATGKESTWFVGPSSALQEPCFVPRSADSDEGDGWVLTLAHRILEMRTDLLVFDAQHISEGPVATIKLPVRLKFGLHGNWRAH